MIVNGCVCVCERERERERESILFVSVHSIRCENGQKFEKLKVRKFEFDIAERKRMERINFVFKIGSDAYTHQKIGAFWTTCVLRQT